MGADHAGATSSAVAGTHADALGADARPAAARTATEGPSRPNVIMIVVDDATNHDMRYMRHVQDLVADRGVTLANGTAPTPLCVPARASLLTGQYTPNHHANAITGSYLKFNDHDTLPVWLQRAGYRTAMIGKYLNGYGHPIAGNPRTSTTYVPPGWTDWRATVGLSTYKYNDPIVNHNGRLTAYDEYNTGLFGRFAVQEIKERSTKPLFMMVNFVAPHSGGPHENDDPKSHWPGGTPFASPRYQHTMDHIKLPQTPDFWERDTTDKPVASKTHRRIDPRTRANAVIDNRQRVESLLSVDDAVDDIVGALRATGQLDNTIIMFSSDNGYLLGEHNRFAKPRPYEQAQAVPMFLAGPGIPRGKVVNTPVGNPDLAATVAAVAQVRPTLPIDGQNILPMLTAPDRDRIIPIIAWEVESPKVEEYRGVRTATWTYIRWAAGGEELYNRRSDPFELDSLAKDRAYGDVLRQMRSYTDQYVSCAGDSCHN